uniref:Roadblock/LAMTOR2 domain-containing protein n=1 Tax=Meloidogyne javanica TaxID=6303 RepID=A0A915M7U8_MELJA
MKRRQSEIEAKMEEDDEVDEEEDKKREPIAQEKLFEDMKEEHNLKFKNGILSTLRADENIKKLTTSVAGGGDNNAQFHSFLMGLSEKRRNKIMSLKIVETLENLIKTIPEVHSILILDSDGVPIVSAGEEIRNRSQYSASYNTLVEQSRKLGMGTQKYWIFRYEMSQVVLLSIDQFAVFVMASSNANTGILCALPTQLKSVLDECSQIVKEVANGQIAQIVGQSPRR